MPRKSRGFIAQIKLFRVQSLKGYITPLFLTAFFIIALKSLIYSLPDTDLWWHLSGGRATLENFNFLREDSFSHSMSHQPWNNYGWLIQIPFYLIWQCFGIPGLYAIKIIFSIAILFISMSFIRLLGARGPFLVISLWLEFLIIRNRFWVKPELITLLFMVLFPFLIYKARESSNLKFQKSLPWILFILMIIWVNSHLGCIYGLGIVFLINVGSRLSGEKSGFVKLLDKSFTLVLLAFLINPYGPSYISVYLDVFLVARGLMTDVQPTVLSNNLVYGVLFLSCVISIFWGFRINRKKNIILGSLCSCVRCVGLDF